MKRFTQRQHYFQTKLVTTLAVIALVVAGFATAAGSTDPSNPNRLISGEVAVFAMDSRDVLSGATRDVSGNGLHANVNGASVITGKFGNGYSVAPGTNLQRASASQLNFGTGDFTVMAWVKTTNTFGVILDKYTSDAASPGWMLKVQGNCAGCVMFLVNAAGIGWTQVGGTIKMNDGQWHHVAAVRQGSSHRTYIDGVQDVSFTTTVRDVSSSVPLTIGTSPYYGTGSSLNGGIDEVRLYNRALSAAEIFGAADGIGRFPYNCNAAAPGAPSGLTATGGLHQISLAWSAPGPFCGTLTGYKVYRDGSLLASIGTNVTFVDAGLGNGETHSYTIAGVSAAGTGAQSASATATTFDVASAPLNLTAGKGKATIVLGWEHPATNGGTPVTSYNVYRAPLAGGIFVLVNSTTEESYTDATCDTILLCEYHVTAVNIVGEGPASNDANIYSDLIALPEE